MKVTLAFTPPGGGEQQYSLDFELPGVPQQGDYIRIERNDEVGTYDFLVKRTWWLLRYSDGPPARGVVKDLVVECEHALSVHPTPQHKKEADAYEAHGQKVKRFDRTLY